MTYIMILIMIMIMIMIMIIIDLFISGSAKQMAINGPFKT